MKNLVVIITIFLTAIMALKANAFDYYKLALQWPPGVCFTRSCAFHIAPTTLKIHGLWPTNIRGPDPKPDITDIDWTSSTLQVNLTRSFASDFFREEMKSKWPQLLGRKTNWEFWVGEWNKHGKVSGLKPLEYFQKALDAYDAYTPLRGIYPSDSRGYYAHDLQRAAGGNPFLKCFKNPYSRHESYILREMVFCFDNTATIVRHNCPVSLLESCGGPNGFIYLLEHWRPRW